MTGYTDHRAPGAELGGPVVNGTKVPPVGGVSPASVPRLGAISSVRPLARNKLFLLDKRMRSGRVSTSFVFIRQALKELKIVGTICSDEGMRRGKEREENERSKR